MPDLAHLIQQGGAHAWIFVPTAILLGALHGLEPGHSKTMMAAFIIAVRGTVWQAVLLGLAATISHTAIVWAIALGGLYFGGQYDSEGAEPYLQLASAALILGLAGWMFWRTLRHQHDHDHHHDDAPRVIDTGAGQLALELFEDNAPPRWRLRAAALPAAGDVSIETEREGGARQTFGFVARDGYLESIDEIPEPHAFVARLTLSGALAKTFVETYAEHDHAHGGALVGLEDDSMDAHQREHAEDIRKRFGSGQATTGQIVLFGLTGGLIPCPSSITILVLCLQLKQFMLGAALVLCFSIGLAVTMVGVGAAAALSVHHVSKRWSNFGAFADRAPFASVALMVVLGLYTAWLGWSALV